MNNILIIGDLILDKYIFGKNNRLNPESVAPLIDIKSEDIRPGGAANVAMNLNNLNNKIWLMGIIGNDSSGKSLLRILNQNKINTSLIRKEKNTTIKTRFMCENSQLLRVDNDFISELNIKRSLKKIDKIIKKINLIYIADYKKGVISKILIHELKKRNVPIFVDPKNQIKTFQGVEFIKMNQKYFKDLMKNFDNPLTIKKKFKINNFIVTQGSKGSFIIDKYNNKINVKGIKTEVFDVSGAGDTFGAAFVNEYLNGKTIFNSLKYANEKSAEVVRKIGTSTISENNNYIIFNKKNRIHINNQISNLNTSRIGFTNGCFDLLHPGHLHLLNECKKFCDYLILGLNSDKSVKLLKGKDRPVYNQDHRSRIISSLNIIDLIIVFDEKSPIELIKMIKPNILFKGGDYKNKEIVGHQYAEKIKVIEILKNWSTTSILKNER